jgi:hypothetical protein
MHKLQDEKDATKIIYESEFYVLHYLSPCTVLCIVSLEVTLPSLSSPSVSHILLFLISLYSLMCDMEDKHKQPRHGAGLEWASSGLFS